MNIAFALDYFPRRMKELGYGDAFITRYHHMPVSTKDAITVDADNQLLLFVDPLDGIIVTSKRGKLDLNDHTITDQQHEHSGKVTIVGGDGGYTVQPFVTFIQIIPLNSKKKLK